MGVARQSWAHTRALVSQMPPKNVRAEPAIGQSGCQGVSSGPERVQLIRSLAD
jgi:hypothetical protein